MDDAREWTATAPRPGAGAPTAVQPGDPWGAPVWAPDRAGRRRAGRRRLWRRPDSGAAALALVVDLSIAVDPLDDRHAARRQPSRRLAPRLDLVAQAFGRTWQLVVPVAYFVLSHGTAGQTLGKRLLGARVVDESGEPIGYLRALGRCVATIVAAIPFGLGLAAAGFRRDRRGLHDFLAGTRVVRTR